MDREELEQEVRNGEHLDDVTCIYCGVALTMDQEGWWFDPTGSTYCGWASRFRTSEVNHVPV